VRDFSGVHAGEGERTDAPDVGNAFCARVRLHFRSACGGGAPRRGGSHGPEGNSAEGAREQWQERGERGMAEDQLVCNTGEEPRLQHEENPRELTEGNGSGEPAAH
jgi:hypothetical protein